MKFSLIVEARTGSRRLPNKILLKIKKKNFLEYLLIRLSKIKKIDNFIVATSTNKKDREIIQIAKKNNFKYFAGSEKNVLKRVIMASRKFSCENIIRITSDCPLIDVRIIQKAMKLFENTNCDYLSNTIKRSYPDGMDVEIFKFSSLVKASKYANSTTYKEWTTWSLIQNPKIFNIKQIRYFTEIKLSIFIEFLFFFWLKMILQILKKL